MDKGQAHTKLDRKYSEDDQRRYENAFKDLVGTPSGRYLLWRLLFECNTLSSPFSTNALITAHASGRQSIGLALLETFTTLAPNFYVKLLEENLNERSSRDSAHTAIDRSSEHDGYDSIGNEDE